MVKTMTARMAAQLPPPMTTMWIQPPTPAAQLPPPMKPLMWLLIPPSWWQRGGSIRRERALALTKDHHQQPSAIAAANKDPLPSTIAANYDHHFPLPGAMWRMVMLWRLMEPRLSCTRWDTLYVYGWVQEGGGWWLLAAVTLMMGWRWSSAVQQRWRGEGCGGDGWRRQWKEGPYLLISHGNGNNSQWPLSWQATWGEGLWLTLHKKRVISILQLNHRPTQTFFHVNL